MYTTRQDAEQQIITALENSAVEDARAEFDIDAIFEATHEYSADLQAFVQIVDIEHFWLAVLTNPR